MKSPTLNPQQHKRIAFNLFHSRNRLLEIADELHDQLPKSHPVLKALWAAVEKADSARSRMDDYYAAEYSDQYSSGVYYPGYVESDRDDAQAMADMFDSAQVLVYQWTQRMEHNACFEADLWKAVDAFQGHTTFDEKFNQRNNKV